MKEGKENKWTIKLEEKSKVSKLKIYVKYDTAVKEKLPAFLTKMCLFSPGIR